MAKDPPVEPAWTREELLAAVIALVAARSPGADPEAIGAGTRFARDLGWDEWYLLGLIEPVEARTGVALPDPLVRRLRSVGQLASAIWSRLEAEE